MRVVWCAVVLSLTATVAQALTAEALWQSWQDAAAQADVPLQVGKVVRAPQQITLQDVTIGPDGTDGDARAVVTLSQVVLREGSDGSVSVADLGQVRFDGGKSPNLVRMQLRHTDLSLQFADRVKGLAWTATAKDLALAAFGEDEAGLADDIGVVPALRNTRGAIILRDLAAEGWQDLQDGTTVGVHFELGYLSYDLTNRDPVTDTDMHQSGAQTNFVVDLAYAAPEGVFGLGGDLRDNLAAGLTMALDMRSASAVTRESVVMKGAVLDVVYDGGAGTFSTSVGPEGVALAMTQEALSLTLQSRALFAGDLTFGLGALALEVVLPLIGAAPRKTIVRLTLDDLATTTAVWDYFDPKHLLPRLPAALTLVIQGTTSPEVLEQMLQTPPTWVGTEANQLTLRKLSLSVAGASLDMTGALALATGPAGFAGQADVRLDGSGKLLDSLIAMGIVPDEAASALRMLMAIGFDRKGEVGDLLVSRIEARPDGSLYVNGARMR